MESASRSQALPSDMTDLFQKRERFGARHDRGASQRAREHAFRFNLLVEQGKLGRNLLSRPIRREDAAQRQRLDEHERFR